LNIIEYYHFDFSFNRDIIGSLLFIGGFSLKGYLENFLELFSPAKMTLNAPVAPLSMNMGNSTGQAGGSGDKGNSSSTTLSMNMDNPTGKDSSGSGRQGNSSTTNSVGRPPYPRPILTQAT
jgi:hypothetical protein